MGSSEKKISYPVRIAGEQRKIDRKIRVEFRDGPTRRHVFAIFYTESMPKFAGEFFSRNPPMILDNEYFAMSPLRCWVNDADGYPIALFCSERIAQKLVDALNERRPELPL